jgi:hypothetical protein
MRASSKASKPALERGELLRVGVLRAGQARERAADGDPADADQRTDHEEQQDREIVLEHAALLPG